MPLAAPVSVPASAASSPRLWLILVLTGAAATVLTAAILSLQPSPPLKLVESNAITFDGSPQIGFPLMTDGSHVFYRRIPDGAFRTVPVAGGGSQAVFDAASTFDLAHAGLGSQYLAIKRDGASVEGEVWAVPRGSGVPHRVGDFTAVEAQWSPDGRRIVMRTNGQLRLADSDGTNAVTVVPPRRGVAVFPRWSPDGSKVRFTVDEPTDGMTPAQNVWEVGRDGGGLRLAIPDWNPSLGTCCGVWTSDGRHFVFQANRGDRRSDLWVLTEPSRLDAWLRRPPRVTALTAGPLSLFGPTASPDGRTLFAVGKLDQGQLVKWDQATRSFVSYLGGISGTWVSFSPDRQQVAYVGYPDRQLWRARVDGGDRQALVGGDFELDGVAWSPDGKWIAFRSRMSGRRMKIFLMPSSGGEPYAITEEDRDQGVASWSPDGRRLVFGDVPRRFGVPEGGEVLRVYDVEKESLSTVPGSAGLWTARWSTDGRYLSALTIDSEMRLKLYDTTTNRWRSTDAVHVDNPSWSKDGRFVYYDTEGGVISLRRLNVTTDKVEDIAVINFLMTVYGWSGLSPDDEPLILRNLTLPEIYALTVESRH